MNKPICVMCGMEFKVLRTGVYVFEMFNSDKDVYRIWQADKLSCRKCGIEIVDGYGINPIAEHFQEDFEKIKVRIPESNIVYCLENNLTDLLRRTK